MPSARECEVLALLAGGRTDGQIADLLELSPATVQTHVRNAKAKLGARTRAQAVAIAIQRELITSSPRLDREARGVDPELARELRHLFRKGVELERDADLVAGDEPIGVLPAARPAGSGSRTPRDGPGPPP